MRICGDYKVTVNPVANSDSYPLPRIDDLFAKLSGGTIFSKLDLAHAYQQIPLETEAKPFTTINTHKGLFQFNRLPFSAPSIFQRILETLLVDIPSVCVYLDDILVSGIDERDHLQNLQKVLQKLEGAKFTLKRAKCEFGLPAVTYLGHCIDRHGLHPSSDKTRAIKEALIPSNVTELKAFLGLINYYHKFMSNLSCLLAPLHRLLQKNQRWVWTQEQDRAFNAAKELLQSTSVLAHYDPERPILVSAGASPYG